MRRFFRNPKANKKPHQANDQISPDHAAEQSMDKSKIGSAIFFGTLTGLLAATGCFLFAPTLRDDLYWALPAPHAIMVDKTADGDRFQKELKAIERRIAHLKKRWAALIPNQPYLVVDTSGNQIFVMKGKQQLHRGICSTGSYILLRAADHRQWIFRTPRGYFRVLSKLYAPVWYMPDWAFVEEGRPIPPRDSPERFEPGVLGEYALSLGRGYLIHGTLYKRMLGMPVTHGCIRLGDEDLKVVWKNSHCGTPVLIY